MEHLVSPTKANSLCRHLDLYLLKYIFRSWNWWLPFTHGHLLTSNSSSKKKGHPKAASKWSHDVNLCCRICWRNSRAVTIIITHSLNLQHYFHNLILYFLSLRHYFHRTSTPLFLWNRCSYYRTNEYKSRKRVFLFLFHGVEARNDWEGKRKRPTNPPPITQDYSQLLSTISHI